MATANVETLTRANGDSYTANEGRSSEITGTLIDAKDPGSPIVGSAVQTFTLEIIDEATNEIIRPVDSILNTKGGTLNQDGTFIVKLDGGDNVIVNQSLDVESHIAIVAWSWIDDDGDPRDGDQRYRVFVANGPPEQATGTPTPPAKSTLVYLCLDEAGDPEPGVVAECMVVAPTGSAVIFDATLQTDISDENGYARFPAVALSTVQVRRGDSEHWQKVVIGLGEFTNASSFIGKP